ncbi:hypothetical protein BKA83DRAFT_4123036 [Pisolithus microcarpus]|nr:hypothetical protein BKA83DRAFT_4123036 [Pisolithus microcarpus]
MARTKQTAKKATGGHAARVNLHILQKKRGKARLAAQRFAAQQPSKPSLKIQSNTNAFCVMCRDGGNLWKIKGAPQPYFVKGFYSEGEPILPSPPLLLGAFQHSMTSQVAYLPTALLHLCIETLEVAHSQVNMFHSFLQSYFPKGGYNFSHLGFNLGTPESMEVYEKAASDLAKTLSPYSRVVPFPTTHGDEDRGDLFAGFLHGQPVAPKVLECLQLLLNPLKDIIKGGDIIFNVCGSVVNMEKSFNDVKKAAQIFNPRSMIPFDAPHLQLAATGPYLHSLLDNTIIQGYDVSSAALFALHDSAMLGRHSNIVLIFWRSGDIVVEKLVWTDKNIRPWGNHLPVQCPQCGTMQKWVGGSANKTLSFECKYIDCGKNMGPDMMSLPPQSYTFTMPKGAQQLNQGNREGSSWLKSTL